MTDTELFQQKFTQWREYLGSDNNADINTIRLTLSAIFNDMGAYDAFEAVCKASPSTPISTMLFGNLTSLSYFQLQIMRIRRLIDKPAVRKNKDVSIYSLRRVIDEIKEERDAGRFTRGNVCNAFNIAPSKTEVEAQFVADISNANGGSFSTGSIIAGKIHTMLDGIFDTNGSLKQEIVDELEKRVYRDKNDKLKSITDVADKYIAHSATPDSRTSDNANNLVIAMSDLKEVANGLLEAFYICTWIIEYQVANPVHTSVGNSIVNLTSDQQTLANETYETLRKNVDTLIDNAKGIVGITD
ncbi:MAG TPA: hypothetical protein PKV52_04215 [Candidatus Saccharibacteria bacterium]|nr:hypothetical protein [Candidatus Saccharibacteria bacterium]